MWILLLWAGLLQAAPACPPGATVTGNVYLLCRGCLSRAIPDATLRLESRTHVAEVKTDRNGAFAVRDLPPGDYRPSIENHKLAWSGAFSIIRVPDKGCIYAGLSFSAYGPAEKTEEALMTVRNYLSGAIDLMKDWFR